MASGTWSRCQACGYYGDLARHTCPPRWRIWIDGHHDPADERDGRIVHAEDAEDAARDGVEEWDECERDVLDHDVRVLVRPADDFTAPGEWFVVSAEATVDYSAHPCNPPAAHAASPWRETTAPSETQVRWSAGDECRILGVPGVPLFITSDMTEAGAVLVNALGLAHGREPWDQIFRVGEKMFCDCEPADGIPCPRGQGCRSLPTIAGS